MHTFADIGPPNILDGAGATAVDTFSLSGSNDYIRDGRSRLQDKDCVSLPGLSLALTISRASSPVVTLHAPVEGSSLLDDGGGGQRDVTTRRGKLSGNAYCLDISRTKSQPLAQKAEVLNAHESAASQGKCGKGEREFHSKERWVFGCC